jgi:hypothetical protein
MAPSETANMAASPGINHLSRLVELVHLPSTTRLSPLGRDDRCDDGVGITPVCGDIPPNTPSVEFVDDKLTMP